MHLFVALLALVPLLAAAQPARGHHHHHELAARMADTVARREAVSAGKPRALAQRPRRKVKRACQAYSTSAASATSASVAAAVTTSASDATYSTASSTDSAYTATSTSTTDSSQATDDANAWAVPSSASSTDDWSSSTTDTWTSSTSSSATATSTASASTSTSSLTPNGIKAGIAGGDAYDAVQDYIGWWYDWSADPSGHTGTPIAVPMLWGDGSVDSTDASRYAAFQTLADSSSQYPYIIGFEEPDCSTTGSANIGTAVAAGIWDTLMAAHASSGSLLISPSMCKQADETWLGTFETEITVPWDITNLHINKNSMDGVNEDLDHYWNTYGKPMWITEFACVDDSNGFTPCTDQDEINTFINDIVALFQSDSRVYAYAYSNGEGLGDVWPMTSSDGSLSESGQTYLSAIKSYA